MRLVTYSFRGTTRTGAISGNGEVIDLGRAGALAGVPIPNQMIALLSGGDQTLDHVRRALDSARAAIERDRPHALSSGLLFGNSERGFRLEAPVPRPGKVLGIGLNYRDHARETKAQIPTTPVVFAKVPTCITGPGMPVHIPKVSNKVDWEAEFCFVI